MGPDDRAARFVDRFREGWSAETDEGFFAVWREVLHPDVRLIQPMVRPTTGLAAFEEEFTRLRSVVTGLTAEVHRWASSGDTVFIEFTLTGTISGDPIAIPAVDRMVLDGEGRCVERQAYFDPTPLAPVLLKHPSTWPFALRGLRQGSGDG